MMNEKKRGHGVVREFFVVLSYISFSLVFVGVLFFLLSGIAEERKEVAFAPFEYHICSCESGADADCVEGSDSTGDGSYENPWKSYQKARNAFNTMNKGDKVLFCQGGSFSIGNGADVSWENVGCVGVVGCEVGDYIPSWGSGNELRPLIKNNFGSAFDFTVTGGGVRGSYVLRNLILHGNNMGSGVVVNDKVHEVTLDNLEISNFNIGVNVVFGNNFGIRVLNSDILDNGKYGISGGSNNGVIENNAFRGNGKNTGFLTENLHQIYWRGDNNAGLIKGNILEENSRNTGGKCDGIPVFVTDSATNLVFEENVIREGVSEVIYGSADLDDCQGIVISGESDTPSLISGADFTGLKIRRNKIENVGDKGIVCRGCVDSLIENNVIVHEQSFPIKAIVVENSLFVSDPGSTNVDIKGNTIYVNPDESSVSVSAKGIVVERLSTGANGFAIVNNLIYYGGTNTGWACFDIFSRTSTTIYEDIDNDLCFFGIGRWEVRTAILPTPLEAWQAETVFGDDSLDEDPEFVNPSNDLSLQETSPAIDAGHLILSPLVDFDDNIRLGVADIGAYEFVPSVVCGDGIQEGTEACDDGNTLNGDGCSDLCEIEFCGDGKVNNGNEQCDDGNTLNGDGCNSICQNEQVVSAECGNGIVEEGEECDGTGRGCSMGGYAGTQSCNVECKLNACVLNEFCGDGIINGQENCDGVNLGGQSCSTLGLVSGILSCDSECEYDVSMCDGEIEYTCGNGIKEQGEKCDGSLSCSVGGYSGIQACNADCTELSGCLTTEFCGDGVIQSNAGEQCDDSNLNNEDNCTNDCKLKVTGIASSCGNGNHEIGEVCDDDSISCRDIRGYAGIRACNSQCDGYVLSCLTTESCGDGIIQGSAGEKCDDGNVLNGDGCSSSCKIENSGSEIADRDESEQALRNEDEETSGGRISSNVVFLGSLFVIGIAVLLIVIFVVVRKNRRKVSRLEPEGMMGRGLPLPPPMPPRIPLRIFSGVPRKRIQRRVLRRRF